MAKDLAWVCAQQAGVSLTPHFTHRAHSTAAQSAYPKSPPHTPAGKALPVSLLLQSVLDFGCLPSSLTCSYDTFDVFSLFLISPLFCVPTGS